MHLNKRVVIAAASLAIVAVALIVPLGLGGLPRPEAAFQNSLSEPSQNTGVSNLPQKNAATPADSPRSGLEDAGGSAPTPAYEQGVVLVGLKDGVTADELNKRLGLIDCVSTKAVAEDDIALGYVTLELASGVTVADAERRLAVEPLVEAVQPNYLYYLADGAQADEARQTVAEGAAGAVGQTELGGQAGEARQATLSEVVQYVTSPNVALADQGTGLNDPYAGEQWALEAVNAYDAWDAAKANGSVTVAVIDSGMNVHHEDFGGTKIVGAQSVLDKKVKTDVTDTRGHGTAVAGVIAATANNSKGVAGVSYNAGIMPVQVIESDGSTSSALLTKALSYVADNARKYNVKVANVSIGSKGDFGDRRDAAYDKAVAAVHKAGVLVVYAAGNYAYDADGAYNSYPCDYDGAEESIGVIGAARSGASYKRSDYSNYNFPNQVTKELTAPGDSILSTSSSGSYEDYTGTSFAAPYVAGVAALAFACDGSLTPAQVRNALCNTAKDLHASGWDDETGYGMVDAKALVANLEKGLVESATSRPAGEIIDIKAASLTLSQKTYTYTGKPFTPNLTVMLNDKSLVKNVDYTVVYKGNTNAGTATVTVTGKGNYKGNLSQTFKIERAPLSSIKLSATRYAFNGGKKNPKATVYGVKNGAASRVLESGKDYTLVEPAGRTNVGTYVYKAKGKGNYTGTVKASFKVVKAANTMTVRSTAKTVKASKLKSSKQKAKAIAVKKARGTVRYKKVSGSRALTVNAKTGEIIVAKGTARGSYKAKVRVRASGGSSYKSLSKTVTVTIRVK